MSRGRVDGSSRMGEWAISWGGRHLPGGVGLHTPRNVVSCVVREQFTPH